MTRRILVVDDEPALRSLVARAFRERGYEVVEAADGMAALDVFQSASAPFDLVVTNSRMPHLDGPHLVACLRERDATLPIIHLSGSHGGDRRQGMPEDVPTLLKPFHLPNLLVEAERMISLR